MDSVRNFCHTATSPYRCLGLVIEARPETIRALVQGIKPRLGECLLVQDLLQLFGNFFYSPSKISL